MINLFIFHYHLLPGGVTSVIADGIKAIMDNISTIKARSSSSEKINKITIVTGRKDNTENLYKGILSYFPKDKQKDISQTLYIEINPEIDYATIGELHGINPKEIEERVNKLANSLITKYTHQKTEQDENYDVWWIHNYHLGKNPIFTEALVKITEKTKERLNPKLIFQIHDFPEAGRYDNLKLLRETIAKTPYPISPNLRYVPINKHDREVLVKAGIPQKHVFLLENPSEVHAHLPNERDIAIWRERIVNFYENQNNKTNTSKEIKLILYPIRAIRRKNVFEAALISLIANKVKPETEYKLIVTLPGVSQTEKNYSKQVEKAYKSNLINGYFKTGTKLEEIGITFEQLVFASDMILSSSVQEGFGFSFIQSIIWGRPIVAREIPVLKSFSDIFENYPHHFYTKIICPVPQNIRKSIVEAYKIKVEAISTILPPHSKEKLHSEIEKLTSQDTIDFSFLDVKNQIELLKTIKRDCSLQEKIYKLNKNTIDRFNKLIGTKPKESLYKNKTREIQNRFGFSNYSDKFIEIVSSLTDKNYNSQNLKSDYSGNPHIWDRIIDKFAEIDYLRLIYE